MIRRRKPPPVQRGGMLGKDDEPFWIATATLRLAEADGYLAAARDHVAAARIAGLTGDLDTAVDEIQLVGRWTYLARNVYFPPWDPLKIGHEAEEFINRLVEIKRHADDCVRRVRDTVLFANGRP